MRKFIAAAILSLIALPGFAGEGIIKVKAAGDVASTMDALEAAVTGAGATVFARVDHAGGAEKVGLELAPEQLLIFGNPKLGTPAMQDDAMAGLYLPLKVLVYEDDDGQTWLAYEAPAEMLGDLNVPEDAAYVKKMTGALAKLTGKAAGN
ncbi:Protein crcB homolog 1 [hydrothermal vent metagenome]|uniref:Protein crcB homolog 1 n=1 Tax=hydrothermal vent metagenome TaxID=652676 RepID=A0A3B0SHS8_9ZZZZ